MTSELNIRYNNYTNVSTVITDLQEHNGKLDKLAILNLAKDANVPFLKEVFEYAYNPFKNYGIKEGIEYTDQNIFPTLQPGWKDMFLFADRLIKREVTGNKARETLVKIIEKMQPAERDIAANMIKGDLRCGATASTINKVFPKLVPVFSVSLCGTANEKSLKNINYPAYSDEKIDAMRCCSLIVNGKVECRSRSGKLMQLHGELDEQLLAIANTDMMIDGELAFLNEDMSKILPRKTSNGIGNKAVKNTISVEEAKRAILIVWDAVPMVDFLRDKSDIPYEKRRGWLTRRLDKVMPSKVQFVEQRIVRNYREAMEMCQGILDKGGEGIILKNMDSLWEGKRLNDNLKIKKISLGETEADLRVLSIYEGKKRLVGKLGGFVCGTDDGKIVVRVGSGFSDKQRKEYFTEDMIGKILTAKYEEVISSEGAKEGDPMKLFLPVFIEFRHDKDVTNTLEELL